MQQGDQAAAAVPAQVPAGGSSAAAMVVDQDGDTRPLILFDLNGETRVMTPTACACSRPDSAACVGAYGLGLAGGTAALQRRVLATSSNPSPAPTKLRVLVCNVPLSPQSGF